MKGAYFFKVGESRLAPADDRAQRIVHRMDVGEARLFRPMGVRDITAHRRYWLLMTMIADNVERIEIYPNRWMEVKDREDAHVAIKMITRLFTPIFDGEGRTIARIVHSTSFEEMTSEEWDEFWPKVLQAIEERVIPGVRIADVVVELHKLMGLRSAAS